MKAAIAGCGHIATQHVRVLRKLPSVDVVGVCDPDSDRAAAVACRFQSADSFDDLSQMIAATRPDVVHVLTPPRVHLETAGLAMRAGCHVLVEKPMAMNASEGREMVEMARQRGVVLGVSHNYRFVPAFCHAMSLIESGRLGQVRSVDVFWRVTAYRPQQRGRATAWIDALPGGVFQEVAPHLVYVALAVAPGLDLAGVAVGSNDGQPDELRAAFRSATGPVTLGISVNTSPVQKVVRVYGTRMSLQVDLATSVLTRLRARPDGMVSRTMVNLQTAAQIVSGTAANAVRLCAGTLPRGHETMIRRFYQALENGAATPAGAEEGLAVVAVLDQIWAALDDRPQRPHGAETMRSR